MVSDREEAINVVESIDNVLYFIKENNFIRCTDELEEELEDLRYEICVKYKVIDKRTMEVVDRVFNSFKELMVKKLKEKKNV